MRPKLSLHKLYLCIMFLMLLPGFGLAQQVSGKIISSVDQLPIASASVELKSSSKGSSADEYGSFSINAKMGDVLIVSALGFKQLQYTVNKITDIVIVLEPDSKSLNEVVVTALGIKKETKRITYSIQDVKTADLVKAREPNPINSLKGKVAGLNVNINNEMLRAPSINFRGEGNILFVVDGVPITTDTWNISPDDIESYTMLKGQTASALYGALARNGAIIINTKKGSKDKRGFSIEFNSSTMFEKGFLAFPKYQDEYGPGSRGKYAFVNGIGGGVNDNDYDVWGPRFNGQLIPQYDGIRTPGQTYTTTFGDGSTFNGDIKPTPWVARGKDNLKNFLQTGMLTTNHVSIGATGDKYNVRFGLGHTYQKAIVPNMNLNTTNFNLSAGYDFSKKIKLTADINYSRQYSPNFPDVNYGPNSMIYNVVIWAGADWDINQMKNYWQPGKIGTQQIYSEYQRYNNPWFMVNEWLRPHYKNDVYGYLSLNWKVAKGVEFMYRPSISTYNIFRQEKMPYSAGSYGRNERMGDYREDTRMFFEANNEVQVKYNSKFFKNFLSVDGFIGGNIRTARYNGNFASTDYLNIPGLYTLANSLRAPRIASISAEALTLSGYYSFDFGVGKYATVNVTGRYDKQSTLPLKNNSYYYPSVGVATVVTDYFDKLPNAISFLKFRGSYAEGRSAGLNAFVGQPSVGIGTGQGYGQQYFSPLNMGLYELTSIGYGISNSGTYNNALGAGYADGLLNPELIADNRKTTEVGMDIRFLKNRIGLDVTYFRSLSELLVPRSDIISQSSGFNSVTDNFGKVQNTGWEVMINGVAIQKKNFQWYVNVNWSTFNRIWKEHPNPNFWSKNGSPVDLIIQEGYIKTPDGQLVHGTDGTLMRFRDAGAGAARRIMGEADPDWSWGVTNTLTYKNFRFGFQFDGVVGGVFHNYLRQKTLQGGRHLETATGLWGQNRPNDVNTVGSLVAPGITLVGAIIKLDPNTGEITNMKDLTVVPNAKATSVQSYSSRYAGLEELNIIDKTFTKLREVTLTYQLPATLLGKSVVKKAEVSLVCRNVYLFFNKRYKDVDPDQYTQDGGSGLQTPTTRRFGFNINLTF